MIVFIFSNAVCCCESQVHITSHLHSLLSGSVNSASIGSNLFTQFTIPKNLLKSCIVSGGFICVIAVTLSESTSSPSGVSLCPKNLVLSSELHLL